MLRRIARVWLLVLPCVACILSAACLARPAFAQSSSTVFRDAANFQNNGAYDLAVEEWQKFLKRFPQDQLADQARHYLGVCYMQLQPPKYKEATQAFEQTLAALGDEAGKFKLIEDLLLNLGWCRYSLGQAGQAEQLTAAVTAFDRLYTQYPEGKYADQAIFFKGEALYLANKKPEAVAAYQTFVEKHPQSSRYCDGLYALGVTQEELADYPGAGKTYDLFLQKCADSELIPEVRMRKAETILQQGLAQEKAGQAEAAQASFAAAATTFAQAAGVEDFNLIDHALYRQGIAVAKQNQPAEAAKLFMRVVNEFPKSIYAAEAELAAARAYYQAEAWGEARAGFEKVAQRGADHRGEAAHWIAKILIKQGQPADAYALASSALKNIPADDPFADRLLLDQADALYEQAEKKKDSIPLYEALWKKDPAGAQAPQALYNAAFTAMETRAYEQAVRYAGEFTKTYADHRLVPDVRFVSADSRLLNQEHAAAEQEFQALIAAFGSHADAPLWKLRQGLAQYLGQKYDEAVATLTPLPEQFKQPERKAEAWYLLGSSQLAQGKVEAAASSLNASIQAAPTWRQADETLVKLARAYDELDKSAAAKEAAERVVNEFPKSQVLDQAQYRLGELAYGAGEYAAALQHYNAVLGDGKDVPLDANARYGAAWSQSQLGKQAEAVQLFGELMEKHPDSGLVATALRDRGALYHRLGEHQNALGDLDAFLTTKPEGDERADTLYLKALSQIGLKQHAAAVQTLESILKEFPNFKQTDNVLYEWAWALRAQDMEDAAVAMFGRLAKEHPQSPRTPEARFHLGQALYAEDKFAAAAEEYAASAAAAEGDLREKALHRQAWSMFKQDKFPESAKLFGEQLQAAPAGELARKAKFMVAESLFRQDQFAEALKQFAVAKAEPDDSETLQQLTLLHGGQSGLQTKNYSQAIAWLDELLMKFPASGYQAEALYYKGRALQESSKPDDALKVFAEAAEQSPGEFGARSRFMMGEIKFAKKEYEEAQKDFRRVMLGYGAAAAPDEIKPWQAKSGYEAARVAEVQVGEAKTAEARKALVDQARELYRYVVEKHPESPEAPLARERLTKLAELK